MKRILIIDDDPQICKVLSTYLKQEGFDTDVAPDGRRGFTSAMEGAPDLIICDLDMPELNGQDMVRLLRQQTTLTRIPIVYLSGCQDEDQIRHSMNLGGDDFLRKPASLQVILQSVKARLDRKEQLEKFARNELRETIKVFLKIINDLDRVGVYSQWSNELARDENCDPAQIRLVSNPPPALNEPGSVRGGTNSSLLVKTQGRREIIQLSQVRAILANGEYSIVHWGDDRRAMFRKAIRSWARELPANPFIRIHRSAIINLEFLKYAQKTSDQHLRVRLEGFDQLFTVSQRAKPAFNRALKQHQMQSLAGCSAPG